MMKQVKNTVRGELVMIGKSVYVRDDYIREDRLYMLTRWDDISRSRLVKGSKIVEVDFTFLSIASCAVNDREGETNAVCELQRSCVDDE